LIKADCSINWRDQDGKLYCFANAISLVFFQDLPKGNILKAREAFERMSHSSVIPYLKHPAHGVSADVAASGSSVATQRLPGAGVELSR
jgi:hypothetical protein